MGAFPGYTLPYLKVASCISPMYNKLLNPLYASITINLEELLTGIYCLAASQMWLFLLPFKIKPVK